MGAPPENDYMLRINPVHKNSFINEITLKLAALMMGNNNIERKSSIQFLGVMLDKHISWIDHLRTVENKIAKNIVKASFSMKIHLKLYISCIFISI